MNINRYGIINYSNNCYLNVIIQLFLSNSETEKLIIEYLNIDNNKINPKKLLDKLSNKINVNNQNDAQEIFLLILDIIPNLQKHFTNIVVYKYSCSECKNKHSIKDIFSTFNIYSPSLEDSIYELIKTENFDLDCDNCKKKCNTYKKGSIKELGNILVFNNLLKHKLKIVENITYGDNKYKLTGLIKHFGNQFSGHYIYIDYINKLVIDDINISSINNIDSSNIYLLFYTL
tara:strand:- start:885 stop:1577 length:693 start_codon:yes stop_codon:yes gene_type:complete